MIGPMARVILFVHDVPACAAFYRDVLGLTPKPSEHGADEWQELEADGVCVALHKAHGGGKGGGMAPHKIVFKVDDVRAARETLVARGAKMHDLREFGKLMLCDGEDPAGNRFQISNR